MISLGSIVYDVATQLDNARAASGENVIVDAGKLRDCIFKPQMTLRIMALAHIELHPDIDHISPMITMLEGIEPHRYQTYNRETYVDDVQSMLATLKRRYGHPKERSQIGLWTMNVADRDVTDYGLKMCANVQVQAKENILKYLHDMRALRTIVHAKRNANSVIKQHDNDDESLDEYNPDNGSEFSYMTSGTSGEQSVNQAQRLPYISDSDDDEDDLDDRLSHITVSTTGGIPTYR